MTKPSILAVDPGVNGGLALFTPSEGTVEVHKMPDTEWGVVNLLKDIQAEMGLTYVFIAHNLAVVKYVASRVGVMYLGKLVETAPSETLYANPQHPYTKALLSAIPQARPPVPGEPRRQRIVLGGDVPSALNPPAGCRFHTRCPVAMDRCRTEVPADREVAPGHAVACHLY